MLEVTVKTLDSQNHSFTVPDESTVKEFKEQISPVLKIPADKQRLIFCGKVLKDDKKLSEYDVNGKVLHVVQSLPPQANSSSGNTASGASASGGGGARGVHRDTTGFLLGAFTIPQDMVDPSQVQNIVQDVVSGMGELGRNATVMSRASDDGSVDVQINLGRVPMPMHIQSEAQLRMNRVQTMLMRASHLLDLLEDGAESNNSSVADFSSQTERENAEQLNSSGRHDRSSASTEDVTDAEMTSESSEVREIAPGAASQEFFQENFPPEDFYRLERLTLSASSAFANVDFRNLAAGASMSTEPIDLSTGPCDMADPTTQPDRSTAPPAAQPPTTTTKDEPKATAANAPNQDATSATVNGTEPNSQPSAARSSTYNQPSVQTLANLLDEVIRVNTRLHPCLERCRDVIREDSALHGRDLVGAHRVFSRVSQLLHFLSHAYHSLSDLHVNFSQPPPRSPRVRIISSTHGPPLLHGIPLQAQINISATEGAFTIPTPSTGTSTTTTANTNNSSGGITTSVNAEPESAANATRVFLNPIPPGNTVGGRNVNMQQSQNPVVLMEVSPPISLDGLQSLPEAAAPIFNVIPISSSASPLTLTDPPNHDNATQTPTETAPTQSNSSQTSTTTSSPSFSGQAVGPIPFRNLVPVPLSSMGALHHFDSSLPCHSIWALEPFRRRHNAGTASRSTNTAQPTAAPNPNLPAPQDDQLHQMISNIMMSLLNHPHTPTGPHGFTVFASSRGDSTRGQRSGPPSQPNVPTRSPEGNVLSQEPPSPASSAAAATPLPESRDEMIQLLDQCGITDNKLNDLFTSLNISDENILYNFLCFFAQHLTSRDLANITFGNYECLTNLKSAIQQYMYTNFFHSNTNPAEEDVRVLVKQIVQTFDFDSLTVNVQIKPGSKNESKYQATIRSTLDENLMKIFRCLLEQRGNPSLSYGENLITACRNMIRDFYVLNDAYTLKGNNVIEKNVQSKLNSLPAQDDNLHAKGALLIIKTAFLKICAIGRTACASRSHQRFQTTLPSYRMPPTIHSTIPAEPRSLSNSDLPVNVEFGSEAWHNTVPHDWVPIVTRDVQRQRRQAPQAPFSNAYLSGMPSKRRKIMTNGTSTILEHSQSALSNMLQQAISSANVKPQSNIEEVKEEASQDQTLQASFNNHMRIMIQDRLHKDIDYCSERFPNSEKYFNMDHI